MGILGEPKAWADDDANPAAGALVEEVVGILSIRSEDKAEGREGIIVLHETCCRAKHRVFDPKSLVVYNRK